MMTCPVPDWSWLGFPAMTLAACIGYAIVHLANAKTGRYRAPDRATPTEPS